MPNSVTSAGSSAMTSMRLRMLENGSRSMNVRTRLTSVV